MTLCKQSAGPKSLRYCIGNQMVVYGETCGLQPRDSEIAMLRHILSCELADKASSLSNLSESIKECSTANNSQADTSQQGCSS